MSALAWGLVIAWLLAVCPRADVLPVGPVVERPDVVSLTIPGRSLVDVRLGRAGPVAVRVGSDPEPGAVGRDRTAPARWRLPPGDAVYLAGGWWIPLRRPAPAPARAPALAQLKSLRERIAPADDGAGRDRLYRAAVGDVTGDGRPDLVVSFRRPFQPTLINATRPESSWRDASGMSAHVGVYDPEDLRPTWVAGTLVRPIVDLAVCDGSLAVAYGRLDRRGVVATAAWRWQGFGFLPSEPLPGPGQPACVDVDGDGRLDPAILRREAP